MIWPGLLVVFAAGVVIGVIAGWRAHLWDCQRSNSCPLWTQDDTGKWCKNLKAEGWETPVGRHYPNGRYDRHPTPKPAEFDNGKNKGVPSKRMDTPTAETDLGNPNRRT